MLFIEAYYCETGICLLLYACLYDIVICSDRCGRWTYCSVENSSMQYFGKDACIVKFVQSVWPANF